MNRGPDPMSLIPSSGIGIKKPERAPDPAEYVKKQAERAAYKDAKGNLVLPAHNILSNIMEASKNFKIEKGKKIERGLKVLTMVKGSIDIEPELPIIIDAKGRPVKNYEIKLDAIRTRMTGKVATIRALIPEWQCNFLIKWNPLVYDLTEGFLREIVVRAGDIGCCDWHPRYGAYDLVEWEVKEE